VAGGLPKTYHIWTIGCQMNAADSRALADGLEARGLRPALAPADADIILLNTCVVRESAESKALGRLSSLGPLKRRRPDVIMAVMGCLVGDDDSALRQKFPYVDLFLRPSDPAPLYALLDAQSCADAALNDLPASPVAAYLPISYGCDHHCTYCIVRLRRGPQRSRPIEELRAEAADLLRRGAVEITLLGQNVDGYGVDLPGRPDLADLLEALHDLPGLLRLRFLTSHPSEMGQRILDTVARLSRVCEHIELPVQAGSDAVLRHMGRNYTVGQYLALVERIRATIPRVSLGTDVIVGFCGETDADYQETRDLVERVRFDVVHIAAYSVRAGTPAERLADDVPADVKEARRKDLEELQTRISGEINAGLLGQTVEILVEARERRGRWRGRTRNGKLVFFEDATELAGRLADVRIVWAGPWSLIGERVVSA
jgi:tRNA-2-methylthio-N6-dimethylallyladenosine synthase